MKLKQFFKDPKSMFPGQQPQERVYLLTRPHWFIFFKQFAVWLVFAAVLVIFDMLVLPQTPLLEESPGVEVVNLIKTLYLMYIVSGLFAIWIQYYLNYQIITNERLVDVDQKNLLHHTTSELYLHNIEDVTAEVKGVFGTLLNFGTIYVQTAGQITHFELNDIPNPHRVAKLILDLYERLPDKRPARNRSPKKPFYE